jgi:hypothetical protein
MKKLAIIAVLMLFLLSACEEELPPSPPPPGGDSGAGRAIAGMAGALPTWAADAKNVAITPAQPYYGDGVVVSVSNFDYIYQNGYVFNSQSRVWEKFSLQGEQVKDWVKTQGIGSVSIDQTKFKEGDNYLVIYACAKVGSDWDCNNRKWMLVIFKVMGSATGAIPELANVDQFVLNRAIPPFVVIGTTAEKDNFAEINVIRYDAKYREPNGLVVLVHVFDFNNRADVDKTMSTMFRDIIINGWKEHKNSNIAVFLDETDHRVAVWSSGKEIIYVESFEAASANKETIEAYLSKYPSDLQKLT